MTKQEVKEELKQQEGDPMIRSRVRALQREMSQRRMMDDVANELGCSVHRSKVGEINVYEMMQDCGAEVGGEGTGGVIVPAINACRDSFVGMAFILEALMSEGVSLGEMCGRIPRYALVKEKISCRARDVGCLGFG